MSEIRKTTTVSPNHEPADVPQIILQKFTTQTLIIMILKIII